MREFSLADSVKDRNVETNRWPVFAMLSAERIIRRREGLVWTDESCGSDDPFTHAQQYEPLNFQNVSERFLPESSV